MLVLARRVNESIMVGDDIEIVVIDIKGDQVKLGIKAPRSVKVHRKEVYDEILNQNKLALSHDVFQDDLKNLTDLFNNQKSKKDKEK